MIDSMNFEENTDMVFSQSNASTTYVPSRYVERVKHYGGKVLQVIHFGIVMVYLWAGLVEFIQSPSYFDGYGDAAVHNKLPDQLIKVRASLEHTTVFNLGMTRGLVDQGL